MNQLIQAANGKWLGILIALGVPGEYLTGKNLPCPVCNAGKDRFRWLDYDGRGNWVCSTCNPDTGDGMELLQEYTGKSFAECAIDIEEIIGKVETIEQPPKKDPNILLEMIAKGTLKLTGDDPASQYLKGRGLTQMPINVRYHPSLTYYDNGKAIGRYQAMIARVQDINGNRISFHVTYLQDGKKANVPSPRKILPPNGTISGAGVYLGKITDRVLITEGMETGLAGMQLFSIPDIAALSAGGMERIVIPEGVKKVTILGDNDENYRGQLAAYRLANRLARDGFENVEVEISENLDFLDDLNSDRFK